MSESEIWSSSSSDSVQIIEPDVKMESDEEAKTWETAKTGRYARVMPLERVVNAHRTTMSLDARFTQLRRAEPRAQMVVRRGITRGQISSVKNRRLALQMSRRPTVVAELRGALQAITNGSQQLYSVPGQSRRGRTFIRGAGGIRRRSNSAGRLSRSASLQSLNNQTSPNLFRGRGRGRARRSSSVGRLSRSQSLQSLNGRVNQAFRGRGRPRGRGMAVARGFVERKTQGRKGRGGLAGRGRGGLAGRGRGGGQNRGMRGNLSARRRDANSAKLGFNTSVNSRLGVSGGNFRGRGSNRGRGRGGRRGRLGKWQNGPAPSKETLDSELDQYMAATKSNLDKELDSYMNQTDEKWE